MTTQQSKKNEQLGDLFDHLMIDNAEKDDQIEALKKENERLQEANELLWQTTSTLADFPIDNMLENGEDHSNLYRLFPEAYFETMSWKHGRTYEKIIKFQAICRGWIERNKEEEEEEECCQSCGTTCLDHSSNKGRGSEEACHDCTEIRCKHCPCECDEGYSFDVVPC